jgi:DNA invertase Pin-like site-specific DNA recombinase
VLIGYARLSVGDPEGLTLQIQTDRLMAYGCERIYSEVVSGNAKRRPEWERLKAAIATGRVSEVVALRMDRLSRSWTAIGEVIELFSQPGAPRLTLLDEPQMDLGTIGGRTVAGVLSSVAAGERERIAARAKAGLGAFFASGRRIKVPFGITTDHDNRPIPDRRPWLCTIADQREWSRADVALQLWECWESAPSRYAAKREAAARFNLQSFGGGSAAVWACNPGLRGARTGGKRDRHGGYPAVQEGAYEPLIDPQRHLAAVAVFLRERASNSTRVEGRVTPLSGKAICAGCGYRMQFHRIVSRPGTAPTFRCRREGCRLFGRRIRYSVLMAACRDHLLEHDGQVRAALVAAFSPPAVDADLEARVAAAQRGVESRRALVAVDPMDADMQRSLAAAESTLAALLAARNTGPVEMDADSLLRAMGALLSGAPLVADANGRLRVELPPGADPAAVITDLLLRDELWEANAGLLVPLLVHSLRVDEVAGAVEVIAASGALLPMKTAELHVPWNQAAGA